MIDLATVITNLLSAIPWIGPDLVQFISVKFLKSPNQIKIKDNYKLLTMVT